MPSFSKFSKTNNFNKTHSIDKDDIFKFNKMKEIKDIAQLQCQILQENLDHISEHQALYDILKDINVDQMSFFHQVAIDRIFKTSSNIKNGKFVNLVFLADKLKIFIQHPHDKTSTSPSPDSHTKRVVVLSIKNNISCLLFELQQEITKLELAVDHYFKTDFAKINGVSIRDHMIKALNFNGDQVDLDLYNRNLQSVTNLLHKKSNLEVCSIAVEHVLHPHTQMPSNLNLEMKEYFLLFEQFGYQFSKSWQMVILSFLDCYNLFLLKPELYTFMALQVVISLDSLIKKIKKDIASKTNSHEYYTNFISDFIKNSNINSIQQEDVIPVFEINQCDQMLDFFGSEKFRWTDITKNFDILFQNKFKNFAKLIFCVFATQIYWFYDVLSKLASCHHLDNQIQHELMRSYPLKALNIIDFVKQIDVCSLLNHNSKSNLSDFFVFNKKQDLASQMHDLKLFIFSILN